MAGQNEILAPLWARAKIDELERDLTYNGPSGQVVDAITELGLEFRLVTAYTSFVAVDRSRTVDGPLHTVVQPVEAPEGVDPRMAGAPQMVAKAKASRKPAYLAPPAPTPEGGYGRGASGATRRARSPSPSRAYGRLDDAFGSSGGGGAADMAMEAPAAAAPRPAPRAQSEREESKATQTLSRARLISLRGALDASVVERVIREQRAALGSCRAQVTTAPARTTLRLRFFITATGNVIQIRVLKGSNRDAGLERCLMAALKRWRFPAPRDGAPVEVVYDFAL